ncbi:MAG: class I SAM-dependent methyltransferase [Chloroflexi bacterium]|nr:class I SAM-dependent methyltransferase [Chloroflexota bacterium]
MRPASAFDLYRFRARLRLRLGGRGPVLTMLSAERYVEVPTLLGWLAPRPSERLLDCGSARSVAPAYVAARYGAAVYAVDRWAEVAEQSQIAATLDRAVADGEGAGHEPSLLRRILRRPGAEAIPELAAASPHGEGTTGARPAQAGGDARGRVRPEEHREGGSWRGVASASRPAVRPVQADLTALPFPGGMFDAALAVSTVEHVADDGAALRELARVLRPGGALALSVPFGTQARDLWRDEQVYDRVPASGPVFFQRVYDWPAVEARLIGPSGLRLEGRVIYAWHPRDVTLGDRARGFPLRGLAQLWRGCRAIVTTPEHLHPDESAVCCLLLRRAE